MVTVAHNFTDRRLMAAWSRGPFPGPRRLLLGGPGQGFDRLCWLGRQNLAGFEMLARMSTRISGGAIVNGEVGGRGADAGRGVPGGPG